jgi:hypothetical protein
MEDVADLISQYVIQQRRSELAQVDAAAMASVRWGVGTRVDYDEQDRFVSARPDTAVPPGTIHEHHAMPGWGLTFDDD